MINIYQNPDLSNWDILLKRPEPAVQNIHDKIQHIVDAVRQFGDDAIRGFTKDFDGVLVEDFAVSGVELDRAQLQLSDELKIAIKVAKSNIEKFHRHQLLQEKPLEVLDGVTCWRQSIDA